MIRGERILAGLVCLRDDELGKVIRALSNDALEHVVACAPVNLKQLSEAELLALARGQIGQA